MEKTKEIMTLLIRTTEIFDKRNKPLITYFTVSDYRVENMKVTSGVSLDSDHRLVVGSVKVPKAKW